MLDYDFSLIFLWDSKASEVRHPEDGTYTVTIASLLGCARLRGGEGGGGGGRNRSN